MFPDFGRIDIERFGIHEGIPAYFVMMMVAFAVTTPIGVRWARQSKLDAEVIIDLNLVSLVAGVAGARILHVFVDGYFWDYVHLCTNPASVSWHISHAQCTQFEGVWDGTYCHPAEGDCFAWAKFWQGGLVWYGGLIGAGIYAIYFLYRNRFPIGKAIDYAGGMLPLG